jgi:putative heme-binding domain-containing protein
MEREHWGVLADVGVRARFDVADETKDVKTRAAAMGMLLRGGSGREVAEVDLGIVARLLSARSDPLLQKAAVGALAREGSERAVEVLIERLGEVSPGVKGEIVSALVRRAGSARALLGAIGDGAVDAAEVAAEQRQRLLAHADEGVKEMAKKVFGAKAGSRVAVVERVGKEVMALKGDVARGAVVFEKSCAACHRLNGVGHAVGPDLAAVTDRSVTGLLTAILDPNAAINGQFVAYNVETTDERSLSGVIAEENAAGLVIAMGNGIQEAVKRSEIRSIATGRLSLMPEGLEETCSVQELADVIAYVSGAGGR